MQAQPAMFSWQCDFTHMYIGVCVGGGVSPYLVVISANWHENCQGRMRAAAASTLLKSYKCGMHRSGLGGEGVTLSPQAAISCLVLLCSVVAADQVYLCCSVYLRIVCLYILHFLRQRHN